MAVLVLPTGCRDDKAAATAGEDGTAGTQTGDGPGDDQPDGDDDDDADGDTTAGDDADGTADDDGTDDDGTDDGEPPPPTSPTANVRLKGPIQLRNDFSQALGLAPSELCFELGDLSCTDDVHAVTLGGVEPDELGIYEPAQTSAATTSIAVDRIALAACGRRVDADLQAEALIFDLPLSGAELTDADDPAVAASVTTLYRRALLRDPTDAELSHVVGLYAAVAKTSTTAPARDWAVASCFAVLTTMESLFY